MSEAGDDWTACVSIDNAVRRKLYALDVAFAVNDMTIGNDNSSGR